MVLMRLCLSMLCCALIASAFANPGHTAIGKLGASSSSSSSTSDNIMGVNSLADGQYATVYEGLPLFKNRVRESIGFGTSSSQSTPVALTSAGWPAADFQVNLYTGTQQSWGVGNFSCGFIGTGSEAISAQNSATVSNVSHGTGGAYTTFTLTSTTPLGGSANFGFKVTGTTGGVTNIYCYLPEYNTNSGIDNPATSAAFTTEAIDFYKQFGWLRLMWYSNALNNVTQMTSANRITPSNTQTQTQGINSSYNGGGYEGFALTANPGNTSATLASPWAGASGNYEVIFTTSSSSSGEVARTVNITNGSTALGWTNTLTGGNSAMMYIAGEGPPIEWMIALANATGTMGLWINLPCYEDGTDGEPGSYSAAVLQLLGSTYTSSGPIYFERGNENIWNNYLTTACLNNLYETGTGTYSDVWDYLAQGAVTFAGLAREYLPSGWWGTRVFQVEGQQAAQGNGSYYTGDYLGELNTRSSGSPSSDVQFIAIAPYVNPVVGSSDSVATIEGNIPSWIATGITAWGAEQVDIVARNYGLKMASYEGGIQWNGLSSSNTNVAAALADDTGMTPEITAMYQSYANLGFQDFTHFGSGVWTQGGATAPINEFGVTYSTTVASTPTSTPTLLGIQPFESGATITRNVVSASGNTVPGYDFADNVGNTTDCSFANDNVQAPVPNVSFFANGNCLYRVWNPNSTSRTYTVVATFSGVSGSPTTNLIVNGTTEASGVAVSDTAVTLGSATLSPGDNFVVLGNNATQTAIVTQLQFN